MSLGESHLFLHHSMKGMSGEGAPCWECYDSYRFLKERGQGMGRDSHLIGSSDRALRSNADTPRVRLGAGVRETDISLHEDLRPFLFQAPPA